MLPDLESEFHSFEETLESMRLETLLTGAYDANNAIQMCIRDRLFERDRLWDVYRALGSYVASSGYQCADDQQIIRLIPAR